jgi:hypothetical protein
MNATAAIPPTDNRGQLSTIVDALSKSIAAIAIALYACGFLIVSINHSIYGFTETNPFRPRILAAGAWFFLFTGVPATVAVISGRLPWIRFASTYYVGCLAFAFPVSALFNVIAPTPESVPSWWVLVVVLASFVIFFYLSLSNRFPVMTVPASILLMALFVYYTVRELSTGHFAEGIISAWFFLCGIIARLFLSVRSSNRRSVLPLFALVMLAALYLFAKLYYSHMRSSLGGGTPINVVMYFNKDSVIKPNQNVSARLIDESDAGFYIVGPGERRAIFVPRDSVALVYFSDDAADSKLLKR